jgi:hypothetical protein
MLPVIVPGEGNFYSMAIVSFAKHSKILFVMASPDPEWLHVIDL